MEEPDLKLRREIFCARDMFVKSGVAPYEQWGQRFMILVISPGDVPKATRALGYGPWRLRTEHPQGVEFLVNLDEEEV